MATVYESANDDVLELVAAIRERHHEELETEEVTIGVLMAYAGEGDDVAIRHHGYPAAAVISVTPYKQRVQGLPDALIVIDAKGWEKLTDPQKDALIDHELCHLELARDDGGVAKRDDADRPKLKVRVHDWEVGGFAEVIGRHGKDALEYRAFQEVLSRGMVE